MKYILITSLIIVAGCGNPYGLYYNQPYQQPYYYSQSQQGSYVVPQQDNSTYWQEQNARNQYFDSIRPRSSVPSNMGEIQ